MKRHDFNSLGQNRLPETIESRQSRLTNALGPLCVRTADGVLAASRVQFMRSSLPGRPSFARLHLPRSIPVHGVRATHVSGKPARHRDLSACDGKEALSRRFPQPSFPEHVGGCKPGPRLANLCRLRTDPDSSCAGAVRQRTAGSHAGTDCLRARFDDDRPVFEPLSLGAFSGVARGL